MACMNAGRGRESRGARTRKTVPCRLRAVRWRWPPAGTGAGRNVCRAANRLVILEIVAAASGGFMLRAADELSR
jgi:hypothetical protein